MYGEMISLTVSWRGGEELPQVGSGFECLHGVLLFMGTKKPAGRAGASGGAEGAQSGVVRVDNEEPIQLTSIFLGQWRRNSKASL